MRENKNKNKEYLISVSEIKLKNFLFLIPYIFCTFALKLKQYGAYFSHRFRA